MRPGVARWAVLSGLGAFVVLEGIAIARYPGGSWHDPTSAGFRFGENYFCDLTSDVALGGAPNAGAPYGRAALVAFAAALASFFLRSADLARSAGARRAIATTGIASAIVSALVPFTPTLRVGAWHGAVTMTAGSLGLVAAALSLASAFARRATLVAATGAAAFGSGFAVAFVYARSLATHADPRGLAVAQKVAALALMAWMIATVLARPRNA